MKYSGLAAQKGLYAALNENVVLDVEGVNYTLPVTVGHAKILFKKGPYIYIGEDSGQRDLGGGNEGQTRIVNVSVFAKGPEGRRWTKEAIEKIIDLLDNTNGEKPATILVSGFEVMCVKWIEDVSLPVDNDAEIYRTGANFSILLRQEQ